LEKLAPDLIVTQALCDVCAVAEAEVTAAACSLPGRPQVINLEPMSLEDVLDTLHLVARTAGVPDRGETVVGELRKRIGTVVERSQQVKERPRVVILEWLDPPFSCGHWTPELVKMAGGNEVIGQPGRPSRTLLVGGSRCRTARRVVHRVLRVLTGTNAGGFTGSAIAAKLAESTRRAGRTSLRHGRQRILQQAGAASCG